MPSGELMVKVEALAPVAVSLALLWLWLAYGPGARAGAPESATSVQVPVRTDDEPFDRWQTAKGLVVATVLMVVFLFTDWPRDVAALVAAGFLLLSQRFHSSRVMGLIDWPLLIRSQATLASVPPGLRAVAEFVPVTARQCLCRIGEPVPAILSTALASGSATTLMWCILACSSRKASTMMPM